MGRRAKGALSVAFQGERGAFSEEALRDLCGADAVPAPFQRFSEVFQAVSEGLTDAAVIPIENTLHGSVHENYDHLLAHKLTIAGETQIRIVHNLIATPGVSFRQIRQVYSHPVALNQCLDFLAAHPDMESCPFYDTAGSVKMIMERGLRDAAAIASGAAATAFGGKVLRRSIEDDRKNFTRFFLLLRDGEQRPGATLKASRGANAESKTSVVFTTKNRAGAIFRALAAFALRDISLTKIESRPLRGKPWEYLFYVDFLGRVEEPASRNAIAHLAELADFYRVLGSYPRGC